MDPVKITIDGKEVVTTKGKTVIQAAAEAGVVIPHYCYHPKLSIAGNTICPFGDAAAMPAGAFIRKYRDEFEAHIAAGKCTVRG